MSAFGDHSLGPVPQPGERVGPYLLESFLGSGGMASVFRARDASGRVAAVKILNPNSVESHEIKRFMREYSAMAELKHPHIVQVYGSGEHDGYPWLAMELIEGQDLDGVIEQWRKDPPQDRWERVRTLLIGLCEGLQYVHDKGLVHRDIKPSNILVTAAGEPKLSDFGVVTGAHAGGFTQLTMAGRLVGTVAFMAPELITEEDIDARTDLYALGAVLYMLCTLRRPIEAKSVAGYLARHLTEVPRPATELEPDCPAVLERICQRLLIKDKTWRYPSALAVLQALDRKEGTELSPLRGRESLQEQWQGRLELARAGAGGMLGLVGPMGSGCSHTLNTFAEQVQQRGWPVARVHPRKPDLTAVIQTQIGRPLDEALGDDPVLVVADDLDRATSAELARISTLVRECIVLEAQPLMVLFGAHDVEGPIATLISGETSGMPAELWSLEPLDRRAVVAMLRDNGISGRVTQVLGRRLYTDYQGQPGSTILQLRALIDCGWFTEEDNRLVLACPIEDIRSADMPVPPSIQTNLETRLNELDRTGTELVEILSLINRPATASLLVRSAAFPDFAAPALDELLQSDLVARDAVDGVEQLWFTHPCIPRVVRARLHPETRKERHERIARGLSVRRRRANALEVARHLDAAEDHAKAFPQYLQAAKVAARAGDTPTVLEVTQRMAELSKAARSGVSAQENARRMRWLHQLQGEAWMARGAWDLAIPALEEAERWAREEDDPTAISRALGARGRAHYRSSRFSEAEPLLHQALEVGDADAANRATVLRAIADIRLRSGALGESEQLWETALELAVETHSSDDEARARRGLAHLRCIQGRLDECGHLLDRAEELLDPGGDDHVRASVLARSIEIEICAGRYDAALRRCETLVDLARRRELATRFPEAYALLAECLWAMGGWDDAYDAAHQALIFSGAHGAKSWEAKLRTARVLTDLGRFEEAEKSLPDPEHLPDRSVDDPPAQLAAIRSRLLARNRPAEAADMAHWSLTRRPPMLAIRTAVIVRDASLALIRIGQTNLARTAIKRALQALHGPGAAGLRLELLLAMTQTRSDPRVRDATVQVAQTIARGLTIDQRATFRQRERLEELLSQLPDDEHSN